MNRFTFALGAALSPLQPSLLDLAKGLVDAIENTAVEGDKPEEDPAVLVLGSFIAFHTHADINTVGGYQQLLNLCAHRASEDQGVPQ